MNKWLKNDRAQCFKELGELIMPSNAGMVLSVYLRAVYHSKALSTFLFNAENTI